VPLSEEEWVLLLFPWQRMCRAYKKKSQFGIYQGRGGDVRRQGEDIFHHYAILVGFLLLDDLEQQDVDVESL
jgi:hypothetical protein